MAVVNVPLTKRTGKPSWTLAAEVIPEVQAGGSILTSVEATLINIYLTELSRVAGVTDASVRVYLISAFTCVATVTQVVGAVVDVCVAVGSSEPNRAGATVATYEVL